MVAGSSEILVLHEVEVTRAARVATVVVGVLSLPVLSAHSSSRNVVDVIHRQRVVGIVEERIIDRYRSARAVLVWRLQEIFKHGEDLRLVECNSSTIANPGTISPIPGRAIQMRQTVRSK